jgi:hypothetical protein
MIGEDQLLPHPLPSTAVALEGSRRSDEHTRIRRVFVHDQVVLKKGNRSIQSPARSERRILRVVDGRRTLAELYHEVRGSWFRFLDCAYKLTVDSVLDIGDVRDASESHSTELRLADLLIEQVSEEQSIFLRQHSRDSVRRALALRSGLGAPARRRRGVADEPGGARVLPSDRRQDGSLTTSGRRATRRTLAADGSAHPPAPQAVAGALASADRGARGGREQEKRPANVRWWRRLRGES